MNTLAKFEGKLTAIGNRVLVSDMYFGEQTTKGGIILTSDDGDVRGIYPRWGKVHSKGPKNKDDYKAFRETKDRLSISLATKLSMFTGGIAMTLFGIAGLIYLIMNPGMFS